MPRHGKYPDEMGERAVRTVLDHGHEYGSQWEAICSVADEFATLSYVDWFNRRRLHAVWSGGEALHVVQPGDWFSVICLWQQATFAGWHINLQRPLRPSRLGWDTEDLVLDIEVAPDGSWALEDRAEFEHGVDGGYFDRETQHAVMNAVEEALARLGRREVPFGVDWTVLPELARGPVALPDGWESLLS